MITSEIVKLIKFLLRMGFQATPDERDKGLFFCCLNFDLKDLVGFD